MTTMLQILLALPSLIKTIAELMKMAEEAMGAGSGTDKKQSVLITIMTIIDNIELWEKVKGLFSGIINMIALFKFGSTGNDPK